MGNSFLLPLKFLFFFIISVILFSLLLMMFYWGNLFSPENVNNLLSNFTKATRNSVFPAVSTALLFTAFDYRKHNLGFLSSLLLGAVVFTLLFFGIKFTTVLTPPKDVPVFQPFQSEKIHNIEGAIIYTETVEDNGDGIIDEIVIRKNDGTIPGFEYHQTGKIENGDLLNLVTENNEKTAIIPTNPVYNEIFSAPASLDGYIRDIAYCNYSFFSAAVAGPFEIIILTAAFTFFLIICLLFKGLTMWPLLEMGLILFFHRIFLYIFRLISTEEEFINELFFGGNPIPNLPAYIIFALSIVLMIVALLIRTSNRLRKS